MPDLRSLPDIRSAAELRRGLCHMNLMEIVKHTSGMCREHAVGEAELQGHPQIPAAKIPIAVRKRKCGNQMALIRVAKRLQEKVSRTSTNSQTPSAKIPISVSKRKCGNESKFIRAVTKVVRWRLKLQRYSTKGRAGATVHRYRVDRE